MKSYLIDFTDDEGRRRTVTVPSSNDLTQCEFRFTLAAFVIQDRTEYVVQKIHDIKEAV